MRAIEVSKRKNWRNHIKDNAYQCDVLSDPSQEYWIEALDTPFAIQFDTEEEENISDATESISEMCIEYLDWFFDGTDEEVNGRLSLLKINRAYWEAIKLSWVRQDPEDLALASRFDLSVNNGTIKLLEINGETPLLGAEMVYQWNWLQDYLRNQHRLGIKLPENSTQFNEYWELIAGQWRTIAREYDLVNTGISFLVDENLEEDLEMALQLIQIIKEEVDSNIHMQVVYLRGLKDDNGIEIQRGLGLDAKGYFVDHDNDIIQNLWKMYDWSDIQNDMEANGSTNLLASHLEKGITKVIEPLWKQVLSNKGSLALMWNLFKDDERSEYLLETYFDHDVSEEATRLLLDMHVRKPMLGLEGVAISIETGYGSIEEKESFGYGNEGFIIQEYTELPEAFGYHYMLGSWEVDGQAAGFAIRGDKSRITGRHCLIIPHIISDDGLRVEGLY